MLCFERKEHNNPLREWPPPITFISQLSDCRRRIVLHSCRTSDSVLVIEEKLDTATRAQEEDGEGKERRSVREDFRDPSFRLFFIGSTSGSCAGAAWWVEHSSGFFRHEAPVNVRVFLHDFIYTIPQSAPFYMKIKKRTPYKNDEYLLAGIGRA